MYLTILFIDRIIFISDKICKKTKMVHSQRKAQQMNILHNELNENEEQAQDDIVVSASKSGINIRKMTEDEIKKLSHAIHFLCEKDHIPALRAAFAHATVFVDENCETAYTDCRYRIGIGPKAFSDETSVEQFAMIFLHEILHNTQNHRQRLLEKRQLSPKLTNVVTDLEINGIIAAGLCGINLNGNPCDEGPTNGHWDWMFGEHKQVDAEEADNLNQHTTSNDKTARGKKYKKGDWVYMGGLVPGQGDFYDLPLNLTAEQYIEYVKVSNEHMTLQQFADSLNSNDQNNPNNSSGSQQGNSASNSGMQNGQIGQGGQGSQTSVQGSQSGQGTESGNNGAGGSGNYSDGSGSNLAGPDGQGGYAVDTGDGHVTKEKISIRHSDGSTSDLQNNVYIDNINVDEHSELWKEVSEKLGINPISRQEEQKVRDQIAHDIEKQRKTNGYGSGHMDMMLKYLAEGLRPSVVNWKNVLRSVAHNATDMKRRGRDDYSYKRISRRRAGSEYIFPGMVSYVPTLRFAIDTSGSMSEEEYRNVLSEAEGVIRSTHAKLEVCCVDTEASQVFKANNVKDITKRLTGGGGTDMAAAVNQVCSEPRKKRPDVLIIATDGCFSWESLARSLGQPEIRNTHVIILVVYPFTNETYYGKQGELREYQNLCRQYKKDVNVLQAFTKRK